MNSGVSGFVGALIAFAGVIIGLLVSLFVSWLNNSAAKERQELQLKHDAERQERQLSHDAEQRRLERERSLQREIYLGAIEAMGKWQWYLNRMADISLPDKEFPPMIEDAGQLIGKTYAIGSLDTLKTLTNLNSYFIENVHILMEKRYELVVAKLIVDRLETEHLRATERAAQLKSEVQIAYETEDPSLSSLLSAADENNRQVQWIETSLNADFRRGKPVNIFSLPVRITETERPMGGSLAKGSLGLVGREQLLARSDCGSVYQSVRRSAPARSRPRHLFPRICERVVWALPPQSHAVAFPTNGSNRWPLR